MNKKIIKMLFSDMCCSVCKSDFDADCLFELRKEDNLSVLQVVCSNCGKSFGNWGIVPVYPQQDNTKNTGILSNSQRKERSRTAAQEEMI